MGGLAIFFEEEGLSTTQISLIRLHSERIKPPRALWVPFELGRPLGVPNDSRFQKRVLRAAFAGSGLLRDGARRLSAEEASDTAALIDADPDAYGPWYDIAVSRRGRTTVGPSGLSIVDAGKYLAAFLEDQDVPCPRDDMPVDRVLKLAYEDLKAYYTEAITMQQGYSTSHQVEDWLFGETALGRALWRLRDLCLANAGAVYGYLGQNSIVPDRQINPAL